MALSIGIVGLPNVGKSTLFNALTKAQNAQAANYPFCTIEPNKATVPVPDTRLDALTDSSTENHPGDCRLYRHCRPGPGRKQRRRTRQSIPRHHSGMYGYS